MGDSVLDRLDPLEIGFVHAVLAARAAMRLLPELRLERGGHLVEHRHRGQAQVAAMLLQPGSRLGIHQRVEHEAGMRGEIGDDPVHVLQRPHHRPEMAVHRRVVELGQRRLGDHFQRLPGRIRDEVEVESVHASRALWTDCRINHGRP